MANKQLFAIVVVGLFLAMGFVVIADCADSDGVVVNNKTEPLEGKVKGLEGKVKGVQITASNGFPDAPMVDISPEDIESIDVLKEAASSAAYGVNGVGLTTTSPSGTSALSGEAEASAEAAGADEADAQGKLPIAITGLALTAIIVAGAIVYGRD